MNMQTTNTRLQLEATVAMQSNELRERIYFLIFKLVWYDYAMLGLACCNAISLRKYQYNKETRLSRDQRPLQSAFCVRACGSILNTYAILAAICWDTILVKVV